MLETQFLPLAVKQKVLILTLMIALDAEKLNTRTPIIPVLVTHFLVEKRHTHIMPIVIRACSMNITMVVT